MKNNFKVYIILSNKKKKFAQIRIILVTNELRIGKKLDNLWPFEMQNNNNSCKQYCYG